VRCARDAWKGLLAMDADRYLVSEWDCSEVNPQDICYRQNGNHGTGTGLVAATDVVEGIAAGRALELDGSEWFDCGDGVSLQLPGSLTISAWVKIRNLVAGGCVVSKYGWNLIITDAEVPTFYTRNAADAGWDVDAVGPALTPLEWYHLAAVYDVAAGTKVVYENGVPGVVVAKADGVCGAVAGHPLRVGAWSVGGLQLQGIVDSVRVYSAALTQNQVADLYVASRRGYRR